MVFDAGSISIKLLLDTENLKSGLTNAKAGLVSWRDETNKSSTDMLKWGASITATAAPLIAVGYALADVTGKAAAFGKSIKDNARDLGLSTEQYQRWAHAAIASGSSAEEMSGSIRMLTIRLKEASDPASDAARYLKAMGISAYDSNGRLRDTDSVLKDLLPAINALPEGMERNQASMVLFGRSFSNIADLTSLTRDELQKLMDQAPVFSDEKIQKMDDYAVQTALLNEKIQNLTIDIGTELIPVMEDVLDIINDVSWAASPMMTFIQDAAFGINTLTTGLQLLWLQGAKNSGGEYAKQAQAEYDRIYQEWIDRGAALERRQSGYPDMTSYGEADAKRRFGNTKSLVLPEVEKEAADTTTAVKSSASSSSAAWAASSVVGSAGSEMQLFLQREMELGTDYQKALDNWIHGSPTREGGQEGTLAALSVGKGGSGTSSKTATSSKTSANLTPGSAEQTASIKSEYQKQTDAFREHLEALATLRAEQYPILEQLDLVHWATFEETARIGQQKILDNMATLVNFGGTNPIVQNYIVMSKKGPDWTPPTFTAITAPTLESADFTQVGSAVQAIVSKGLGNGTSGSSGITFNQTNHITTSDSDQAANKVAAKTSKVLAGVTGVGGQLV